MDLWQLYTLMQKSRRFEETVDGLWQEGLISGEMHLGTGEEAIIAGVISQIRPEDALALDHRGSAALLMHGIDAYALLRELLGQPDGLCAGMGGHMHLSSREHLAASSGIVGASGPAAAGFALAAQALRPGSIAVAFFGEAAMNQGMLMEAIHLAAYWNLPAIFVCKDDGWAITTQTATTGAGLGERVRGLGVDYIQVDGLEVEQVWRAVEPAIQKARQGKGPSFLHARCVHFEGHFLGFQLLRVVRNPLRELPRIAIPLIRAFLQPKGGSLSQRLGGLRMVLATILATWRDPRRLSSNDPLVRLRAALSSNPARLQAIDQEIETWIADLCASVMEGLQ